MAATLYGAQIARQQNASQNLNYDVMGDNSEAFTQYDPVAIESAGTLHVYTTGDSNIVGVTMKTQTMSSDNETNAKVLPGYIPVDETTIFLMGTNKDLTDNKTDVGTYYDLTGTTGSVQVDVNAGATTGTHRAVMIKYVDPAGVGGTGSGSGVRQCHVIFVKRPTSIESVA